MSEPLLAFREVDVFYGVIQALKQVSLEVNKGETVALIGANGAGKSTLLMSIFGQPRIRSGQILFCGEDISHQSTHYVASGGIAQAPEGRRIFPDMTVEENLRNAAGGDVVGGFMADVFAAIKDLSVADTRLAKDGHQ